MDGTPSSDLGLRRKRPRTQGTNLATHWGIKTNSRGTDRPKPAQVTVVLFREAGLTALGGSLGCRTTRRPWH